MLCLRGLHLQHTKRVQEEAVEQVSAKCTTNFRMLEQHANAERVCSKCKAKIVNKDVILPKKVPSTAAAAAAQPAAAAPQAPQAPPDAQAAAMQQ